MRIVKTTNQFDKQLRLMGKRGKDLAKLHAVVQHLANEEPLEPRYRDHQLTGNFADFRECHSESHISALCLCDIMRRHPEAIALIFKPNLTS